MDSINTTDYYYELPAEKIASHPLPERDLSKLLTYHKGTISHKTFRDLPSLLPDNAFLFFNNTKVIPARLHFKKETGAEIEIFLLSPVAPSVHLVETMSAIKTCTWQCTIGNLKKWTSNVTLKKSLHQNELRAQLLDKENGIVSFSWDGDSSFAEILHSAGETPLPPYIKRDAEASDRQRYQTIYSQYQGAVAAPTAGLHFTDHTFQALKEKKIEHDFLTLHVSAGTFQPIKVADARDHVMHQEQIMVSRQNIGNLLSEEKFIIPVGTTSMRTLESLYWHGVKLISDPGAEFKVTQQDPYLTRTAYETKQVWKAILDRMDRDNTDLLIGETSIMIRPGYQFRVCKGLITNFHQPASTLILLVAALIGIDWRKVYSEALEKNYRFLSYGDSSLLIP